MLWSHNEGQNINKKNHKQNKANVAQSIVQPPNLNKAIFHVCHLTLHSTPLTAYFPCELVGKVLWKMAMYPQKTTGWRRNIQNTDVNIQNILRMFPNFPWKCRTCAHHKEPVQQQCRRLCILIWKFPSYHVAHMHGNFHWAIDITCVP